MLTVLILSEKRILPASHLKLLHIMSSMKPVEFCRRLMPSPQETLQFVKSDHSSEIFRIHNTYPCIYFDRKYLFRVCFITLCNSFLTAVACVSTMRFVPLSNETHRMLTYIAYPATTITCVYCFDSRFA